MYKVVSLFSGCGGADLGMSGDFIYNNKYYEKLPFDFTFACDIDSKALNTYSRNLKADRIVCDDVCNIENSFIPNHDVLVGGFPCQSFSTVNPTKNPFDDRAKLYKQMLRIAKAKMPKVVIGENVKGLMTLHKGEILKKICSDFNSIGYTVYTKLFNVANFGVPQKRERLIIVCIRKDITQKYEFPKETHIDNWVPLSIAVPNLSIDDKKYYFSEKAVMGMKNAKNNMKRGLAQDLSQPCLTITSHLAKVSLNSRDPVLLVDREKEVYRRFTPREAACIQSFPNEFVFEGSEIDAYRQIGNAVPPVFFWHISKSVAEFLNVNMPELAIAE